jgi:hypothetical protein
MTDKLMTVGQLQNLLSKFEPNRLVVLYDGYWDDYFKNIEVVDGNMQDDEGCKDSVVIRRVL